MKDDAISLEGQLMNCESMAAVSKSSWLGQLHAERRWPRPLRRPAGVTTEYEAGGVVTANVEGDFLFSSGRSTLKSSANLL